MSKVKFEFDGTKETYDIALCTHRIELGVMLQNVQDYVRHLRKNETRESIPVQEIEAKLTDMIYDWYIIQNRFWGEIWEV